MRTVRLQGPTDLTGFRQAARQLLAQNVSPDDVHWVTGAATEVAGAMDDLWGHAAPEEQTDIEAAAAATATPAPAALNAASRFTVPARFLSLCDSVLLHESPQRFTLMYQLLCRLKASPGFWLDTLDPERRRAEQMAKEVGRAIHKMHAFVRFFPVQDEEGERYLAWFEPDHFVEEAASPFFARRFANMRWAILTPRCSMTWDGRRLEVGPAGRREDVPPMDAGAALWLTYYRSIFNPARLKVSMMEKEMPRRYWSNLPEAALIAPLIAEAQSRTTEMLTSGATSPRQIRRMAGIQRDPNKDG